jgi:hypothetical protein
MTSRARGGVLMLFALVFMTGCETKVEAEDPPPADAAAAPAVLEVMETFPEDYDFEVFEDTVVTVTFNKEMDARSINVNTFVLVDQNLRTLPADVRYEARTRTARLTPLVPLAYGSVYTADVTHRVRDKDGRHLNGGYEWIFTTRAQPLSRHLVTQPADQATDVSVKTRVVVELHGSVDTTRFDPAMFTLTDASAAGVPGTVNLISAFDGVLTFTPDAELDPAAVYTARLAQGVPLSGGVTLDEDVVWSFTTAAARTATLQLGDAPVDRAQAVAVDADGNVYTAGMTGYNDERGAPVRELTVIKSSGDGVVRWTQRLGSTESLAEATAIAIDSQGDVVVAGLARGDVEGGKSLGEMDAIVLKLGAADGVVAWVTHVGTDRDDVAHAVALDAADNVYAAGSTQGVLDGQTRVGRADGFVAQLDGDGALVWAVQIGSADNDVLTALDVDPDGRLFAAGNASANVGALRNAGFDDILIAEFDPADGALIGARLIGTLQVDRATAIVADAAGIYVGGYTYGTLGETSYGLEDAVVIAFGGDIAVAPLWIEQFGDKGLDSVRALATDGGEMLTMSGVSFDFAAGSRGIVQKFDTATRLPVWFALIEDSVAAGSTLTVTASGVAVDPATGAAFVVGSTQGPLGNNAVVGEDQFIVSFDADGAAR